MNGYAIAFASGTHACHLLTISLFQNATKEELLKCIRDEQDRPTVRKVMQDFIQCMALQVL